MCVDMCVHAHVDTHVCEHDHGNIFFETSRISTMASKIQTQSQTCVPTHTHLALAVRTVSDEGFADVCTHFHVDVYAYG